MRRHVVGVGLGCILALGMAWWMAPSTQVVVPEVVHAPPVARGVGEPVAGPAPVTTGEAPAMPADYARRVAAVESSCDLQVDRACDGRGCVLLLAAPDLDRPEGWAEMVWRSPRFVASTALRDLGVPPGWMPCGTALGALGADTLTVEQRDGTELWCTGEGPEGQLPAALCEEVALRRYGAGGFDQPGVRRLSFAGGG